MKKLFFFILLIVPVVPAQNSANKIPIDTSYTIYSATVKIHKKFPGAVPVAFTLSKNVKEEKNIVYTEVGNRKLHLDIFYPFENKREILPAIILVHGGGWRTGNRTMVYPMAEKLAENGYVIVAVEYRLSMEALYPAAVYDIKSAIRWMRANADKYKIDENRIAIYGTSAGGQLAALVGTTNNDKKFEGNEGNLNFSSEVQAVVDIDGVVDYFGKGSEELYKKSGKPSAGQLWFGVSPKDNPAIWKEASPINHTTAKTPSICFINSAVPRFHAGRDEMIKILNKYKIYSEVHTLPGTVHTFWLFHPWFETTYNYTMNFLNKVFKN